MGTAGTRPRRPWWARPVPRAFSVAVTLVVGLTGCSSGVTRLEGGEVGVTGGGAVTLVPTDERVAAPALSGPLLGQPDAQAALSELRGQVVVLNVWGSWCAPCRKEAPALEAVSQELRPRGVVFLGVNTRDTAGGAEGFVAEFGVTYPSIVDTTGERLLAFRDTLPPAAIPSTLIVDADGRMAARVIGAISETSLRQLVLDVLTTGTAPTPATTSLPSDGVGTP